MLVDLAALMDMPLKPDKIGCNDRPRLFLFSLQPPRFFHLSLTFNSLPRLAILQARNLRENWPSAFGARKARAIPGKMRTRVIALWSRKKPRRWSNVARKHPSATREVWRSIDSMPYTHRVTPSRWRPPLRYLPFSKNDEWNLLRK